MSVEDYKATCDLLVIIPMTGKADSLNVAISCAVLLYEVFNQRRRVRIGGRIVKWK